jgi:hypothetical protein
MALQAQGWCGFNGIVGSGMSQGQWCHGRGDEDGTAAPGDDVVGSGMAPVHSVAGSGRTTLLWARERSHGLGDDTCAIDDVTGSGRGRWHHIKGLDRGREMMA